MLRSVRLAVAGLLFAVAAPVLGQTAGGAGQSTPPGFDDWVVKTMAEWHVPGLAIGAVKDGKVLFAKGYGYRDVEAKRPVTGQTVMAIGSNSKSFTVVLMAMLVDEKKLDWDKPVRTYLPDFEMWDDFATREMTGKDLVSHRSGLPRHDDLWYGRAFTREQLFHRLKYLEPTFSFRSRYQYQNLMFMTAGYLTERITGQSWDQQVRDRIFTPLGMAGANTSVDQTPAGPDFSYPYSWNDSLVRIPFRNLDLVGPAGSINASVEDMLKYIQFRIDQGTANGRRLVSVATERQMQSPQMVTGGSSDSPELGYSSYGLGLGVSTYRGRKLVSHTGGIDGFISAMSWLPEERIGIMVLSNLSGTPVPTMVTRTLYDRLLGAPPADWAERQRKSEAEAKIRQAKARETREAERKPGTVPTHALSAYAGTFEHPGYGVAVVTQNGGDLTLALDGIRTRLKHFHFDVWEMVDQVGTLPPGGRVRFLTGLKGVVDQMAVPLEPTVADIMFARR